MAVWTYVAQFDLTNGGGNDLTSAIIASSLPSGIVQFDILFEDASTDVNNQPYIIQLGDSGGIETTNYDTNQQTAGVGVAFTTGFSLSNTVSADEPDHYSGMARFYRWDISSHLWISGIRVQELLSAHPRYGAGYKELSGELTQVQITTLGGAGNFDSGKARMRYM